MSGVTDADKVRFAAWVGGPRSGPPPLAARTRPARPTRARAVASTSVTVGQVGTHLARSVRGRSVPGDLGEVESMRGWSR